jgi:glutamyl endopeptidase
MEETMKIASRLWVAAAACAAVAALSPAVPALAAPAAAQADGAGAAADGVTLVSGGGRSVTLSRAALAGLSQAAGAAGHAPAGARTAPGTKTGPVAKPGSVIGADERIQEGSTTVSPWGSIVHIELNTGGCTGFLLSRDTVVTAGHCVWDGAWATSYTVYPGRNGTDVKPYGSCSGGSGDLWSNTTWTSGGSSDYDYGMIKLSCDVGNSTGWMGWWYNPSETMTGQSFYVEGFPGDKAYGTMWWDSDPITGQTDRRLTYNIDTAPGESGSPIYRFRSSNEPYCTGWCIAGIHTNGGSSNSGTRFNAEVAGIINFVIGLP